jgi:predicted ester cyclase
MRSTIVAALSVTTLVLSAFGGEAPPPETPAPPPPPPVASAAPTPPPADTTPPAPPPKPALADVIPQTVKGIDDAFNAHDAQKMTGFVTDDCADYSYGSGEAHSRADMATGSAAFFTAFPDVKTAPMRIWIKGNVAIQELAWTGTMKGDLGPFKATNKAGGGMLVEVLTFNDDGLVKELHEYSDDAGLMAQMMGKKGAPPIPTLPTNPPETHIGKGTPDEDTLATWVKGGDDVFNKDDPKAALAWFADDADVWFNFANGPASKGKKQLTKDLNGWFKMVPDQKWTNTNAWGIDGFAIIEHNVSGTHKGAMMGLAASGKPVQSWHWLEIFQTTADGKVQHEWGYANMAELLKQTGQFKMPGDAGKGAAGAKAPAGAGGKKP